MKSRFMMLLLLSMLVCFGLTGCGNTEQPAEAEVEQTTETEEDSSVDYVDVQVERPSEDSEDVIPETDIELE